MRRPITPSEVLAMRHARDAGASENEIAARHGRPRSTVSRIVCGRIKPEAGGPLANPKRLRVPDAVRQELLQTVSVHREFLHDGGPHVKTIARRYGLDPRSLRSRFLDRAVQWIDEFWAKVDKSAGPTACWPWRAGRLQCPGQSRDTWPGRYRGLDGTQHRAHILAWELSYGKVPDGQILRHTAESDSSCDVILCANPLHWR